MKFKIKDEYNKAAERQKLTEILVSLQTLSKRKIRLVNLTCKIFKLQTNFLNRPDY